MKNIKKKNGILLGLIVCLLGVSIANYTIFYKNDDSTVSTSNTTDPANATLVSNTSEEDVISGNATVDDEFFSEYRLNRDKVRSQNLEALQNITKNSSLSDEVKKEAVDESVAISKLSEMELTVENLIKAKGFDDAIVIIHDGYANAIIDTGELSGADAAKIQNIINKQCDIEVSKITISTNQTKSETKKDTKNDNTKKETTDNNTSSDTNSSN